MSVTGPAGFRAAGVAAGLRAGGGLDVALVVNDGPDTAAAGVFTGNRVKAAPVLWSEQVLRGGALRAVVLNAGGANACTGPAGFADTHVTAEHLAGALGTSAGEVAVCSTGLIGERLPMDRLLSGVDSAVASLSGSGGAAAAEAIMTTDTRPKTVLVPGGRAEAPPSRGPSGDADGGPSSGGDSSGGDRPSGAVGGGAGGAARREGRPGHASDSGDSSAGWSVGGMAKGAGMLAPGMATMLCVLTTDAVASAAQLDAALRAAVRVTLDRVDSDGCMSTNDTVLLLASGAAGIAPSPAQLTAAVTAACHDLAQQLVADAEGATKEVAIEVVGAATEDDAVEVARAVARNNLVKTALFGNDPNWGRILGAVGTTGAAFESDALDVAVNGVWVCRAGAAAEDRSKVDLSGRAVTIRVDLHAGTASGTVWTNDLSIAYVHENSAYST